MNKRKITLIAVVAVLLASDIFFAYSFLKAERELKRADAALDIFHRREPYARFNKLFIEKVLKADHAIDYETRFELENAVRGLSDEAVKGQWDKFVNAKDETEAQVAVKDLLGMLADRENG